jgi:hypothetical protein
LRVLKRLLLGGSKLSSFLRRRQVSVPLNDQPSRITSRNLRELSGPASVGRLVAYHNHMRVDNLALEFPELLKKHT